MPQREQLASTPEQPLPKGKGTDPSVLSTRLWGGESQSEREPHLDERVGEQSESMRKKGWTPRRGLARNICARSKKKFEKNGCAIASMSMIRLFFSRRVLLQPLIKQRWSKQLQNSFEQKLCFLLEENSSKRRR